MKFTRTAVPSIEFAIHADRETLYEVEWWAHRNLSSYLIDHKASGESRVLVAPADADRVAAWLREHGGEEEPYVQT